MTNLGVQWVRYKFITKQWFGVQMMITWFVNGVIAAAPTVLVKKYWGSVRTMARRLARQVELALNRIGVKKIAASVAAAAFLMANSLPYSPPAKVR